jgi:hypothetical protein
LASVFLSYDHEDLARASPIALALEANGHSVWWDRHLHGGAEYNSEIESAVERADAVVVLWSAKSIRSAWVRDEAGEGRDRGRLVPVLIEPVKPPMGFRQYQAIDLSGWSGGRRIPQLAELLLAVDRIAGGPASPGPPPLPLVRPPSGAPAKSARPDDHRISRRAMVGSAVAAAAVGSVGGGLWWAASNGKDPRFDKLLEQAGDPVRNGTADRRTATLLEEAVSIRPRSAKAWGLLALVRSLSTADSDRAHAAAAVADAEKAAQRALSLNPKEPNALLAMFELEGSTLDWITRDQRLRQIIAIDPANFSAVGELVLLTQATGLNRESWNWNERALALVPLSADALGKRALKLWIAGHSFQADNVADRLRALYPDDSWAWWVRFIIFALSGRASAAEGMLPGNPMTGRDAAFLQGWPECLQALDQPLPSNIARARSVCADAVRKSAPLADSAPMVLAALGDLDSAFEIADGILLARGPIVPHEQAGSSTAALSAGWRVGTQWMWTPPTAAMRADSRFLPLCEGIGLTDYWRQRGVEPDYLGRSGRA